jgi:hypothetical protein
MDDELTDADADGDSDSETGNEDGSKSGLENQIPSGKVELSPVDGRLQDLWELEFDLDGENFDLIEEVEQHADGADTEDEQLR